MKKNIAFSIISCGLLLLVGLFAAKATQKYTLVTTVYYKNVAGIPVIAWMNSGADNLITLSSAGGRVAYLTFGIIRYPMCTQNGTLLYQSY